MTVNNYIAIQGWMVLILKLKGNELIVFALIYGFTQDDETEFKGSLKFICSWLNCSRPTATKALKSLVKKGLIIKREEIIGGVQFNRYRYSLQGVKKLYVGGKETLQGGGKETLQGGGKETLHNNYIINNNISNDSKLNSDELPLSEKEDLKKKKKSPVKKKKEKWASGSFSKAKDLFDMNYRQFHLNKNLPIGESEGIYWNVKEIRQLSNLMRMLKHKAANGVKPVVYNSDVIFVDKALNVFLTTAAKLVNAWYMDKFTPANFVTNFEAIYTDVKKNISTGYIGDKKIKRQSTMENNFASLEALKMLQEEES